MGSPVLILMRRFILASFVVLAVGCGGAAPIELHERLDVDDLPPVDVHVRVQPEHRRDADRYLHAAVATLRTCAEWLGPVPRPAPVGSASRTARTATGHRAAPRSLQRR